MLSKAILFFFLFQIQIVSSQSTVKNLPGFHGDLPFTLQTGYIGVGELEEVQLFYYFIESERSSKFDPLLLWLTGGPGCTSLTGFFYEIGPLKFNYERSKVKPTLELNPYSWTKFANIIFLDAPVGTGFSYATTWQKYYSTDTIEAAQNYEFLRKWLLAYPKFQSNRLYITGDSYAGKIVPPIVQKILDGNANGSNPQMNLQGYVLGNPVTDELRDLDSRVEFAYFKGLISKQLYESSKENCNGNYTHVDPKNAACKKDIEEFEQCVEKIYFAQILEPTCSQSSPKPKLRTDQRALIEDDKILDLPFPVPWCRTYTYIPSYIWANEKSVRKALHIREGTVEYWVRCNYSLWYTKDVPSTYQIHRNLIKTRLQVLIYSGDHDMAIPYVGTFKWIESLNLSTIAYDWQPWFVQGQVAGYWIQFNRDKAYRLSYATVKGGGHTAPEYKPKECFAMANRWFGYFPL